MNNPRKHDTAKKLFSIAGNAFIFNAIVALSIVVFQVINMLDHNSHYAPVVHTVKELYKDNDSAIIMCMIILVMMGIINLFALYKLTKHYSYVLKRTNQKESSHNKY